MATEWHYAQKGKQFGPVPDVQMRRLAASGQLLPNDLVWREGMADWEPASRVDGLLSTQADEWHYSQGGKKFGPVRWTDLSQMAALSHIRPDDLVWREGMAGWEPAWRIQGLLPGTNPGHEPPHRASPGEGPGAEEPNTIVSEAGAPTITPAAPTSSLTGKAREMVQRIKGYAESDQAKEMLERTKKSASEVGEKAKETMRKARDYATSDEVKEGLERARLAAMGIARHQGFSEVSASEWKRLVLLIGAASFATLVGLFTPLVAGVFLICSLWVNRDASLRGNSALKWSVAAIAFGPMMLPFYLSTRHLREGEVREGGRAWNVLKVFAICWTVTMALAAFAALGGVSAMVDKASNDAEKAGAAIGATIGLSLLFILWFLPFVGSVLLAFLLKKNWEVERGPTGEIGSRPNLGKKPFILAGVAGVLIVMVAGGIHGSAKVGRPSPSEPRGAPSTIRPSTALPGEGLPAVIGGDRLLGNSNDYRLGYEMAVKICQTYRQTGEFMTQKEAVEHANELLELNEAAGQPLPPKDYREGFIAAFKVYFKN